MNEKEVKKVDITLKIIASEELEDEELEIEDPEPEKAQAAIDANATDS